MAGTIKATVETGFSLEAGPEEAILLGRLIGRTLTRESDGTYALSLDEMSRAFSWLVHIALNQDGPRLVGTPAIERIRAEEAEPEEASGAEWWWWRFPRDGRYYAQGRYVDCIEGERRLLPPGYGPWITDCGVHAERMPPGEKW